MSSRAGWDEGLWASVALFLVITLHGLAFGLTDDEAYYWVLGQRPDWGFAYHPPMVAWVIALSTRILGPLFGAASVAVVRIPAALLAAWVLRLSLRWVESVAPGAMLARPGRATLLLLSFGGLFGLSWMMVPDLSLFAGWLLVFGATWDVCEGRGGARAYALLAFGMALSLLSKFSAAFVAASAGLALLLWAPSKDRWKGLGAITLGCAIAAVPILIWNASHEWAAILYQLRDRHGRPSLSLARYARFWGLQLLLAGPALIAYSFDSVRRARRAERSAVSFAALFAAPAAAIFLSQPLWAEFKGHWAFVVWLPFALLMASEWVARPGRWALARAQVVWGAVVLAVALGVCHVPVGGILGKDPKLDVSNDLHGWQLLRPYVEELDRASGEKLPVTASRYQTAGQAAFALGDVDRVTLWPQGARERGEWANLEIASPDGALRQPVLYVADNRYSAGPAFRGARCGILKTIESTRWGFPAKRIDVWRCDPSG